MSAHADCWECSDCGHQEVVLWTESYRKKLSVHSCDVKE